MHTPGPWMLGPQGKYHGQSYRTIVARDIPYPLSEIAWITSDQDESEPNARLIAAAPTMYQLVDKVEYALSRCLNDDGSWGDMPASYKRELLEMAKAIEAAVEYDE